MFQKFLKKYHREIIICIFLVVINIAVFGQTINHSFINYDDDCYVLENTAIHQGFSIKSIKWAFTTTYANFWHPLTWISHLFDCHFFKLNAGMHHMSALVLHIITTVLLFLALLLMTKALWCCAIVAVLFAIHPLHVESVAWIAERKDLVSTLFWFLTMCAYVFYVRKTTLKNYILVVGAFILGLMAKPMLVTLPFVLLLFDWWPLKRFELNDILKYRRGGPLCPPFILSILEKIPLLVLAFVACIIAYTAQKGGGALGTLSKYPIPVRISNALIAYVSYILKTFIPIHLIVPYPHPGKVLLAQTIGASTILIGITFVVFKYAEKYKFLLVGWLWYLGTLVPVIGLIQLGSHSMADRYTYVPLVGLFIMFAWGGAYLVRSFQIKKIIVVSVSSILVLSCSLLAAKQTSYWKNSIHLFTHAVTVEPDNLTAYNNLGTAYINAGDPRTGEHYLAKALKKTPKHSVLLHNRGLSRYEQGDLNGAYTYYKQALALSSRQHQTLRKLGFLMLDSKRYDEAIQYLGEFVQINSNDFEVLNNLGNALIAKKRIPEAIQCYSQALTIQQNALVYYNLGYAFLVVEDYPQAIEYLSQALFINPNNPMAHNNMGNALAKQGYVQEAFVHYKEALRINPKFVTARSNMEQLKRQQGNVNKG